MKGSVIMSVRMFENKKGITYEVRFTYKDKYGRKKYYSKRGFTSERKARKHEDYMRVKIKESNCEINCTKTFGNVFYESMEQSDLKQNTIGLYKEYYKLWIKKEIGTAKINLLDYSIIQNLLNKIGKEKTISVCKSALKVISYTFKYAYNNGYIERIPYAKLKTTGKTSVKKKKIIQEDDYLTLLNYTDNKSYKIMFQIAYYTGMRIGEILALEKNDIDFYNNTIEISKNLYYDKDLKEIGISYPKTQESANYIPIPSKLKQILKEYINNLEYDILVNENGNYIKPSNIYNFLHKFNKDNDTYITMHMFRHTYTSKLYENDVTPKEAQRLLRHKHFSTTMDVYTHLKEDTLQDTIDKVFN